MVLEDIGFVGIISNRFQKDTRFIGKTSNTIIESVLRLVLAFCSFFLTSSNRMADLRRLSMQKLGDPNSSKLSLNERVPEMAKAYFRLGPFRLLVPG